MEGDTSKKSEYTPAQQQQVIRGAFDKYYGYLRANDPVAAYLVIYSLLEVRLNGMYEKERDFCMAQGIEKKANVDKYRPIRQKVGYLEQRGRLRPEEAEKIRACIDERNGNYHDLIWRMNELTIERCEEVRALEQIAMNARKRQKYWHEKANTTGKQTA